MKTVSLHLIFIPNPSRGCGEKYFRTDFCKFSGSEFDIINFYKTHSLKEVGNNKMFSNDYYNCDLLSLKGPFLEISLMQNLSLDKIKRISEFKVFTKK